MRQGLVPMLRKMYMGFEQSLVAEVALFRFENKRAV